MNAVLNTTQKFAPTKQQQDVTAFFAAMLRHKVNHANSPRISIFLNAVAGAGKTSTVMLEVEALAETEQEAGHSLKACSLSFNTNIRDASQAKLKAMGSNVQARTTNQMGRAILVSAANAGLCREPAPKADVKKYRSIINDLLSPYMNNRSYFPSGKMREFSKAVTGTKHLLDAVRSTRGDGSEENLISLINHYTSLQDNLDITAPVWPLVVETVNKAIQKGIKEYQKTGAHDFDDQICLPLYLEVAAPEWDVIFVDEAQDLNRARLEMITRCIKPDGILFFVGDPQQAIQGFTFADTESVSTIKRITDAIEYPLSVCWRCDANIIKIAQEIVPHIEARPGAPDGIVSSIPASSYIDKLESGTRDKDPDLVLSRIKAPLVQDCLGAIRAGKSAIVRGRDIGSSIVAFLDDAISQNGAVRNFTHLQDLVDEYVSHKIDRLNPDKDEAKIAELDDQGQTIEALIDGYKLQYNEQALLDYPDMGAFKKFIEERFSDTTEANENGVKPIVFSTIHKAKGLEYDRVFIIETGKLPHPAAREGWQTEQEYNIIYVACTRAKHELYFVGNVPECLIFAYNEINGLNEVTDLDEEEITAPAIVEASAAIEPVTVEAAPVAQIETPITDQKKRGRPRKEAQEQEKSVPGRPKSGKAAENGRIRQHWGSTFPPEMIAFLKSKGGAFVEELVKASPEYKAWLEENPEPEPPHNGGAPAPSQEPQQEEPVNTPASWTAKMFDLPPQSIGKISDEPQATAASEIETPNGTQPKTDGGKNASHGQIEATEETVRLFFTCKSYIGNDKRCNYTYAYDYYRPANLDYVPFVMLLDKLYRYDDGNKVTAAEDKKACPTCGNKYISSKVLQARYSEKTACTPEHPNSACYNATSADCTCGCSGLNHGRAHMLGAAILKPVTAEQDGGLWVYDQVPTK